MPRPSPSASTETGISLRHRQKPYAGRLTEAEVLPCPSSSWNTDISCSSAGDGDPTRQGRHRGRLAHRREVFGRVPHAAPAGSRRPSPWPAAPSTTGSLAADDPRASGSAVVADQGRQPPPPRERRQDTCSAGERLRVLLVRPRPGARRDDGLGLGDQRRPRLHVSGRRATAPSASCSCAANRSASSRPWCPGTSRSLSPPPRSRPRCLPAAPVVASRRPSRTARASPRRDRPGGRAAGGRALHPPRRPRGQRVPGRAPGHRQDLLHRLRRRGQARHGGGGPQPHARDPELGGKSAAVVLPDADAESTVAGDVPAAWMNNGQACVAQTRILLPRSRYDELAEAMSRGRLRPRRRSTLRRARHPGRPARRPAPAAAQPRLHPHRPEERRQDVAAARRRRAEGVCSSALRTSRTGAVRRRHQQHADRPRERSSRPVDLPAPYGDETEALKVSPTTPTTGSAAASGPPTSRTASASRGRAHRHLQREHLQPRHARPLRRLQEQRRGREFGREARRVPGAQDDPPAGRLEAEHGDGGA